VGRRILYGTWYLAPREGPVKGRWRTEAPHGPPMLIRYFS